MKIAILVFCSLFIHSIVRAETCSVLRQIDANTTKRIGQFELIKNGPQVELSSQEEGLTVTCRSISGYGTGRQNLVACNTKIEATGVSVYGYGVVGYFNKITLPDNLVYDISCVP